MKRKMSTDQILRRYWPGLPKHEVEAAGERIWMRLQEDLKKHDTSLRSLYGDGWSAPATTQLEFQLLSAACALGGRADVDGIADMVEGWTGGTMIARIQLALSGLEKRGLLKVRRAKPADKDGEPVIHFDLTEDGDRAIRRAHAECKQLMHVQENLVREEAE